MPPKRQNKTRNGKRAKNPDLMGLRPVPFTPAMDPPSVQTTVPRTVPLWFTKLTASGGATISIADIRTAIVDQVFGGASAAYYFQVESAAAWGPGQSAGKITIEDVRSGVQMADTGSQAMRPKVGIRYPLPAQTILTYSSPTSFAALQLTSSNAAIGLDVIVKVRVWGSSEVNA